MLSLEYERWQASLLRHLQVKHLILKRSGISIGLSAFLMLTACGSSNLQKYQNLSTAGVAFSETVPDVVDESFSLSVRNDSQELRENQADLGSAERREATLKRSDEALKKRIVILRDFNEHANLLKAYFIALGNLSQVQTATAIGNSTGQLVGALGAVDARLKTALDSTAILGQPITDLIPAVAATAVRGIQSEALRSELQQHGAAVERSLALTEGFLKGLREAAQGDFDALQESKRRDEIDLPYIDNTNLPADWNNKRETLFVEQLNLPAIDKAAEASANLRRSFVALMDGTLSEASVAILVADVAEIVAIFQKKAT